MQGFRWCCASALSVLIVFLGTVSGTEMLGLVAVQAMILAVIIATCVNFVVCRQFVFPDNSGDFVSHLRRFLLSVVGFRAIEVTLFCVLVDGAGLPYRGTLLLIQCFSFAMKFFVMRLLVFSQRV